MSKLNAKPHRRMGLTQPSSTPPTENTILATSTDTPTLPVTDGPSDTVVTSNEVVRVMAYLSADEAEILDELWMDHRRKPARPSKSDILRAALMLANQKKDELTNVIAQQQNSTISRQRAKKLSR